MPMRMVFDREDLVRCRFAVSPLCETHEAVRTLIRPLRHGYHQPWLRRFRAAVAGLDLTPLLLLMPARGYTPDFLGPPPDAPLGSSVHFEDELARLRGTDPDLAHREIARSLACTPGAAQTPAGQAMLTGPARAVRILADATEQAWTALVAADWPRLRTVLEADIATRSQRLAEGGLRALFGDLHPDVSWANGTLAVRGGSVALDDQHLSGRGLLLMPSVFAWPDTVSGFAPPWQPTIIYPARGMARLWEAAPRPATDALNRLLGANRAAILAGLDEPACTADLAGRHRLAPSTVSVHLAVLRDAELVTSQRRGHQVLYRRTRLGSALAQKSAVDPPAVGSVSDNAG